MTAEEFIIAIVDKELKLVNADISACDVLYNNTQYPRWFNTYSFKTVEQFVEWRSYCYQLMRQYKPRYSKRQRYDLFNWINLEYGLKYDFDFKLIPKYEKYKL